MLNQKWFFSRMYPVSQVSMMATSLSYYSGRLPKWGMMHNGGILPLKIQVRPISENDGSASYPTPSASDGTRGASIDPKYFGETDTGSLYRQSAKGTRFGMNLTQFAVYDRQQNWGTPNASDRKGTGAVGSKSHNNDTKDKSYLRGQVIESDQPKPPQLNPDWTELLMGYGVGWTDLKVDEADYSIEAHQFPAPRNVPQYDFEPPRVTERKDLRRDRIKALGNAVVPQCVLPIAQEMFDYLEG